MCVLYGFDDSAKLSLNMKNPSKDAIAKHESIEVHGEQSARLPDTTRLRLELCSESFSTSAKSIATSENKTGFWC
jgi:hypothetical protein